MNFYDVWQENERLAGTIVPVQDGVEARSAEEACALMAQDRNIPIERLQAFEASNPGYREK